MYNKGTKYLHSGKIDKALSCFKKCAKEYSFKELYLNIGNCYKAQNNLDKALEYYFLANSKSVPDTTGKYGEYSLALNNIGLVFYCLGSDSMAIQHYVRALELDPLYGEAIWNQGIARLRTDMWDSVGWQMYQYRFNRGSGSVVIDKSVPFWDGVSRGGKICVITEQGIGDKIMFGRYISKLEEYFSEIVVACHPSLDVFYSPYECVREVCGDVSIPICSLAAIFGKMDERWLDGKFSEKRLSTDFSIGVVCSGSPTHANNKNRSCHSSYFSSLSRYGKLYGLNPTEKGGKNIEYVASSDWGETASLVLGMDLIVSVDTSIVHLAGTLGVPTIMVQPLMDTDFRWGHGEECEWYKSVSIVPNNNNWDTAFAEVKRRIECIKA